MLRAIIFDCDGVIADTEPLHFAALQRVLAEEGIALTEKTTTAIISPSMIADAFAKNSQTARR